MTGNGGGPPDHDPILDFLNRCSHRLTARAGTPEAVAGADAFARALASSTPLPHEPGWLPALDTIAAVDRDTPLGPAFVEVASHLPWTPTQRADDGGVDFALSPLQSVRDLGPLTVGIMYVRPGRRYPLHGHPPQELYLTLAGQARWRFGGSDGFRPVGPDATLYNHPGDLHSAVAGTTPLVALYVLWP